MHFSDRQRLLYLYLREGWRRFSRRLAVGRISAARFMGSTPDRLIVAPTDLRAIDRFVAEEILNDRFPLAGRVLETGGLSPFALDLPSEEFAYRLHGFGWLRHIRAEPGDAAFAKARAHVDEWIADHGRIIGGIAWDPDVLSNRVIAWLSHSPVVLRGADHRFYRRFLKSLSLQMRYLRHIADTARDGEVRLRVRIAIAVASVSMPHSPSAIRKAARNLDTELNRQILPDGGHCSRNPRVGLELLLDLLPLRQTYVNLGHDIPPRLIQCIDRLYPALRFFRHQSGELALFNGATSTLANELMSVLRYDETSGEPFRGLPHLKYERLSAEGTVVIIDTGRPPSIELSSTANAGCLSFEMSSGKHRFIINSGAPKFAGERYRAMSRSTAAHSTVTLNDTSSSRMSRSAFLGPILIGGVSNVVLSRENDGSGFDNIRASHDGYMGPYGLRHEREIGINAAGTIIRGRDRFRRGDGREPAQTDTGAAVARFHIHPAISVRTAGEHEVFLKAPDGETWLLSSIDNDIVLEDDVFFADPSGMRRSQQLTISFKLAEQAEIQWVLSREH